MPHEIPKETFAGEKVADDPKLDKIWTAIKKSDLLSQIEIVDGVARLKGEA